MNNESDKRLFWKEFLKLAAPITIAIVVVSSWFTFNGIEEHLASVTREEKSLIRLEREITDTTLSLLSADTFFLAEVAARCLKNGETDLAHNCMAEEFVTFSATHRLYDQARYIDMSGQERVRVNRTSTGIHIVPDAELQNKRTRDYFINGMSTRAGDIFVSRFELNKEHGKIEVPYNPTLRFVSPVIGKDGKTLGLVVLNYRGRHLINRLKSAATPRQDNVFFVDEHGHWMIGPSSSMEWGHTVKERNHFTMERHFPDAWEIISTSRHGQIRTSKGLFTFATVNFSPDASVPMVGPPPDLRKRWILVSHVPNSALTPSWTMLYVGLTAGFLFLLLATSWYLASAKVRRMAIERELRNSEERIFAITQSSHDAIVMIDEHDSISFWNPAATALFGYEPEEIMGKSLHKLLMPEGEDAETLKHKSPGKIKGQVGRLDDVFELPAHCKDGSLVDVEIAISSFVLKGEWYAVGAIRDITERKEGENKLRRSERVTRALIDASPDIAVLMSPEGVIDAVNKKGEEFIGAKAEELAGQVVYEFLSPDMSNARRAMVEQVLQTGEAARFEDRWGERYSIVNIYPIKNSEGIITKVAGFEQDVTDARLAQAESRRMEQRFRDVSLAVGEFIWESDTSGKLVFLTDDVVHVTGFTAEEMLGNSLFDFMPEGNSDHLQPWFDKMVETMTSFNDEEFQCVAKNGDMVWIQLSGVPFFDEVGKIKGFRGAGLNITDRKRREQALQSSEARLRALAESAYDAIIMIDSNGEVSFWNHAAEKLFGYDEGEAMGKQVHDLVAPTDQREAAHNGLYEFAFTGKGRAIGVVEEVEATRKDGSTIPVERSVSSFQLGNQWFAVATIRDITERKRTEEKLRELATTDSLTGMVNRRRFMEVSTQVFAHCKRYDHPLSMLMMDIDHFKRVNDAYGHDVGDLVLKSLAEISKDALREADIIGRLGGEEFAVLLPDTGLLNAQEAAERLRLAVKDTAVKMPGRELWITVSIGVSTMNSETLDVGVLLKEADIALYKAKDAGRNRVEIFDE